MSWTYDHVADAIYVRSQVFGLDIDHTVEVAPGVMIDYGAGGEVLGVEVLSVGRCKV